MCIYEQAWVTNEAEVQIDIDARLSKANWCAAAVHHLWRAKQLSRTAKFRICKAIPIDSGPTVESYIWIRFLIGIYRDTEKMPNKDNSKDIGMKENRDGY